MNLEIQLIDRRGKVQSATIEKVKYNDKKTGRWYICNIGSLDRFCKHSERRLEESFALMKEYKERGEPQSEIDKQFVLALDMLDRLCERTIKESINWVKHNHEPFTNPGLRSAVGETEEDPNIKEILQRVGREICYPRTKAMLEKLDRLNEEIKREAQRERILTT